MGPKLKKAKHTMIYVPSKKYSNLFLFILQLQILIFTTKSTVLCETQYSNQPISSQYYGDYYLDEYMENFLDNDAPHKQSQVRTVLSSEPTPPLNNLRSWDSSQIEKPNDERINNGRSSKDKLKNNISPYKVRLLRQENLLSPIFNQQLIDQNNLDTYQAAQTSQISQDINNSFDLIEPGSGSEWGSDNNQPLDDITNMLEDSTTVNEPDTSLTAIMPTPTSTSSFYQFSTVSSDSEDGFNRAPILNRRLPKLSITAGQFWKYFIPSDTFTDEDGDLRQLKSTIQSKKISGSDDQNRIDTNLNEDDDQHDIGQYFSWLQYSPPIQLLYGLPTENDAGVHKLMLLASDRFGSTTDETIEINIKQHQSVRAFTHLFIINGVEWDRRKYTSMVDAIGEFIKRISTKVYFDEPLANIVVQSYSLNNQSDESGRNAAASNDKISTMSFTIAWSNRSVPIHPCNVNQLDSLSKMLIDTRELGVDWSSERGIKTDLPPSQNLLKALRPEFTPTSVSIILQGSCEGKDLGLNNSLHVLNMDDTATKVRVKIGKLTWKLGEPIEFRIPMDTFATEKGDLITRELLLSLHTIDGLILSDDPRYSFLEYDQDSQTLYGLPYSQDDHSGQRELLLTARHPKSGHKVREVFIINVEPQDLTTINNRAFKMSLYLFSRSGFFGPIERVALSHKIAGALGVGKREFSHDREKPEMIITDVQKFALKGIYSNNSAELLDPDSYGDKITRVSDKTNQPASESQLAGTQNIYFYKYSWTNSTIGYRGDCPVEVIKENVIFALEQSMYEMNVPTSILAEDMSKNDSARFYNRLRYYFEPESDLIHLRFEPLGACLSVLELHDVGNGNVADQVDRLEESSMELQLEVTTPQTLPVSPKVEIEANDDEYWSILVLIILVIALIFVIIMFFMGMHTYKINQDKRFELQVKLAQARQNSMYLSSMILANQATTGDLCGPMIAQGLPKSMYVVQEEEKGSRKPVILDNEKQLLTTNHLGPTTLQPIAVQLSGQTVHTVPMKPNSTFTLDSIAGNWQTPIAHSPSRLLLDNMNERQRSMTLNHRSSNSSIQRFAYQPQPINHSQSILTVASLAGPLPMIPQVRLPVVYAQVPMINGPQAPVPQQYYSSLQRSYSQQRTSNVSLNDRMSQMRQASYVTGNNSFEDQSAQMRNYGQKLTPNGINSTNSAQSKIRSPSYSSSNSATTHSVISNPNYVQPN